MTLAGIPPTIAYDGTFEVTIEPANIKAPSPMVTPPIITTR